MQFGLFFQDDGGGLRLAVVLVVVLNDVTAIGGLAEDDAVITASGCLVDGGAVCVEVVGFFIARDVIEVDDARLFSAQDTVRQAAAEAWRQGISVDTAIRCVIAWCGGIWRSGQGHGKSEGQNGRELNHDRVLRLGKMRIIWGFLWLFREEIGADKGAEGDAEDAAEQHFAVVAEAGRIFRVFRQQQEGEREGNDGKA